MKKIIMLLCVFTLFFNTVSPVMAAKEDYDHKELLEYDGYGQAMYETVVEQTTFITGQYTENKEFVGKTIDQIKDYAKFWKDEAKDFIAEDSLRDAIERGGGYLLTVGDWVKNLFTDYGEEHHPSSPPVSDFYNQFVTVAPDDPSSYRVIPGYLLQLSHPSYGILGANYNHGFQSYDYGGSWTGDFKGGTTPIDDYVANVSFYMGDNKVSPRETYYGAEALEKWKFKSEGNFGLVVAELQKLGVNVYFKKGSDQIDPPSVTPNPYDDFKKYIDEKINNIVTPQPRPYLSCPNGTKVEMSISGGTFLSADGTVMLVNKDGTATVKSDICKLGWDKPVIKYIGDKAAIETPDGKWQDAETGEPIEDDGGDGDSCSGVVCLAGKIIDGIVGITKAITGLAKAILDGLIGVFVPKDLNFVSAEFDKIKNTFDEKLGIAGDLKTTMESFFAQENSNPLSNLSISLPATGGKPIDVFETNLIEQYVPTVKKVMSGFLILMTVFYLYRKITGRGGVMEK